ncbi:hypothetical protein ACFLV7_09470 [Chloroflexota bacterium]
MGEQFCPTTHGAGAYSAQGSSGNYDITGQRWAAFHGARLMLTLCRTR